MRLFNELSQYEDKFSAAFKTLLMRFSVMETVAAIKFIHDKPIYDPAREILVLDNIKTKCIDRGFSQSKIALIQNFLTNNMTIAKLIQEACMKEYSRKSKVDILDDAIASLSKVTAKAVNEETLLSSERIFIDGITEKVIENIEDLSDNCAYDLLKQLIETCFEHIEKIPLKDAFNNIKDEMKKYQSIIKDEQEYVTDSAEIGCSIINSTNFAGTFFSTTISSCSPSLSLNMSGQQMGSS